MSESVDEYGGSREFQSGRRRGELSIYLVRFLSYLGNMIFIDLLNLV